MTTNNFNNKTLYFIIAAVVLVAIVGIGVFAINNKTKEEVANNSSQSSSSSSISMSSSSVVNSSDDLDNFLTGDSVSSIQKKIMDAQNPSQNPKTAGTYSNYSSDMLKKAETGNVVLFFNASWCPTCQGTVKDIKANMDKIPANLTILSADYDKETELKKKYDVTMQHTFVKVDKNGNLIKKASGLSTVSAISDFAKS
jgi:thiol-disulfide isomerase/thioredoxin